MDTSNLPELDPTCSTDDNTMDDIKEFEYDSSSPEKSSRIEGEEHGIHFKVAVNDMIAERYQVKSTLGRGSFGIVIEAHDTIENEAVAIKIIKNFEHHLDYYYQEASILGLMNDMLPSNSNLLQMHNQFVFKGNPCLVLELLSNNLENENLKTGGIGFPIAKVTDIIRSLISTLCDLSRINIIHADIKPSNIVFLKEGQNVVKLIDYGSSCIRGQKIQGYFQTRFYRSPEVILRLDFGTPVDIWSLGCVAVELLTGWTLFQGMDEEDQLAAIIEVIGMPPESIIKESQVAEVYFTEDNKPTYINRPARPFQEMARGEPGSKNLKFILESYNMPSFLDFVTQCLKWKPEERITCQQALDHPWLRGELPDKSKMFDPDSPLPNLPLPGEPSSSN